jgi:3-oxoacyl-[acyl-carrier protein] reductase
MSRLDGKVVIVTGASKGIGAAIAKGMAREGARVVVNYASDQERANDVVRSIRRHGGEAEPVRVDVSRQADVVSLFAQTRDVFGRLDVLVNNAGIYRFEPFESVTEDEFHRIYQTNVLGCILTMQEALKYFGATGGNIINIATVDVSAGTPSTSLYASSKGALVAMSKVLARELGPRGIRVNVVAPGATETEGTHALGVLTQATVEKLIAGTPLGRLGQPEDIVGPVVFLASEEARWTTGQVLFATGGVH